MNEETTEEVTISSSPGVISNGRQGTKGSLSRHEKPVPHYLRASTGSCHDLCKYGRRGELDSIKTQAMVKGKKKLASKEAVPSQRIERLGHLKLINEKSREAIKVDRRLSSTSSNNVAEAPRKLVTNIVKVRKSPRVNACDDDRDQVCITERTCELSITKQVGLCEEPTRGITQSHVGLISIEESTLPDVEGSIRSSQMEPIQEELVKEPIWIKLVSPQSTRENSIDGDQVLADELGGSFSEPNSMEMNICSTMDETYDSVDHNKPFCPAEESFTEHVTSIILGTQKRTSKSSDSNAADPTKAPGWHDSMKQRSLPVGDASAKCNASFKPKSVKSRCQTTFKKTISHATAAAIKRDTPSKKTIPAARPSSPFSSSSRLPIRRSRGKMIMGSTSAPMIHERKVYLPKVVSSPRTSARKYGKNDLEPKMLAFSNKTVEERKTSEGTSQQKRMKAQKLSLSSRTLPANPKLSSAPPALSMGTEDAGMGSSNTQASDVMANEHKGSHKRSPSGGLSNDKGKAWARAVSDCPEGVSPAAHKLNFRRGKVIHPQANNYSPRRLKFMQIRMVTENAAGKQACRSYMRRRDCSVDDGGSNVAEPGTPAVILRHQGCHQEEKKDAQGLLNLVIEETASKLVEARKSKVKALVGAFETVISLQENKPAQVT